MSAKYLSLNYHSLSVCHFFQGKMVFHKEWLVQLVTQVLFHKTAIMLWYAASALGVLPISSAQDIKKMCTLKGRNNKINHFHSSIKYMLKWNWLFFKLLSAWQWRLQWLVWFGVTALAYAQPHHHGFCTVSTNVNRLDISNPHFKYHDEAKSQVSLRKQGYNIHLSEKENFFKTKYMIHLLGENVFAHMTSV